MMCRHTTYFVLLVILFLIGGCATIDEQIKIVDPTQSIPQPETPIIPDSRTPTETAVSTTPSPIPTWELSPWSPTQEIQNERLGLVSPDGSQLALVGETGLTLVNVDGSNRRADVLTYPSIPQMEGGGFIAPAVTWATDSRSLSAITYSENIWEPEATFTTWRVPIDGTLPQKLHTFSGFPFLVYLSPDQRYLAYRKASKPISNDWEFHIATFDGAQDIVYAQGGLMDFWGWSPDGAHFIFGQDDKRSLSLGSVCGTAQPILKEPAYPIWHVTWVDPNRFVFMAGGDGPAESELRLGIVRNSSLRIGSQRGEYATYQVVPGPGE